MLQIPNLDDRMFRQIVEEARARIPALTGDWTDENAHDPGITLLELFSWLTENQQFYLDQITTRNELKYLKLLGIVPRKARPATVEVFFQNVERKILLPKGTKLSAKTQIFETLEEQWLLPVQIEKVMVFANGESVDFSIANENIGATYQPFGARAARGSRLYLGFKEELPAEEEISLSCSLYEDYPVPLQPLESAFPATPSATVSWYYYGLKEDGSAEWMKTEVLKDDTLHFSYSGHIKLRLPTRMKATIVHPAIDKKRYWIYGELEEEGYELPPKMDKIELNTAAARQIQTLCHSQHFSGNGEAGQTIVAKHYLNLYGKTAVQVYEQGAGWIDWLAVESLTQAAPHDRVYQMDMDDRKERLLIKFGDGQTGRVPEQGTQNIRIISYPHALESARWLGRSNGLPYQSFQLPIDLLGTSVQEIAIQVGVYDPRYEVWVWEDWSRVDHFDRSSPSDPHYIVDAEASKIIFGDHEHGRIPQKSEKEHIRLVTLKYGGGEKGNIKSHVIDRIIIPEQEAEDEHSSGLAQVSVHNFYDAKGGKEAETLEDAKRRLAFSLAQPTRTVTNQDCEEIAKATPGLRVARVKAIPLYVKGLKHYPEQKAQGQLTLVVVPYSEAERPVPSKGFLDSVKRHVDRHRLITTELHVIPPEYIKVSVSSVIVVEPEVKSDQKVIEALRALLHPLDQQGSKGWEFGRSVLKGDVIGALSRVPGVVYIQDLWLRGEGKEMKKDENGDIIIPPYGLVYSGHHEITLVSRTDI